MTGRRGFCLGVGAGLLGWQAAAASTSPTCGPPMPKTADGMAAMRGGAARFAQPVRAGDLPHRYLIGASEAQPVLGIMARPAILRRPDGSLVAAIRRGGFLGIGATLVAVPPDVLALLGEHVALVGLARPAWAALPAADLGGAVPLPDDAVLQMAIVGPFH